MQPLTADTEWHHMVVEDGMEPESLIWLNFSIKQRWRLVYWISFWVIFVAYLGFSVWFVVFLKGNQEKLKLELPTIKCTSDNINLINAGIDQ